MKKIYLLLALCLVGISSVQGQQDIPSTQYIFNQLIINPSYAGRAVLGGGLDFVLIAREQWAGIDRAPSVQTFSGSYALRHKPVGVGITIQNSSVGVTRETKLSGQASYTLNLGGGGKFGPSRGRRTSPGKRLGGGEHSLSFGIQGSLLFYNQNLTELISDTKGVGTLDPLLAEDVNSLSFNTGLGINYLYHGFFVGFSVPHLLGNVLGKSAPSNSRRSTHMYMTMGTFLYMTREWSIQPFILARHVSGVPVELDLSTMIYYNNKIGVGLNYRAFESVDFLLKLNITEDIRFAYSMDAVNNELRIAKPGNSHEFMLGYAMPFKKKTRRFKHPRFF